MLTSLQNIKVTVVMIVAAMLVLAGCGGTSATMPQPQAKAPAAVQKETPPPANPTTKPTEPVKATPTQAAAAQAQPTKAATAQPASTPAKPAQAKAQPAAMMPSQPGLQTNDEWIVAEENNWLPVVDGLGQHLQMARQQFEAKDFKAAATEIRAAAGFLKDESTTLTNPAAQQAIQMVNDELEKLAGRVEAGKVTSIEGLNTTFRDAYQTDIDHRVSGLSAAARAVLADQPGKHFQQAVSALAKNNNKTAAQELSKGIAFAKIEESAATGMAKDDLTTAIANLETVAGELAKGEPVDNMTVGRLIARAHYALANQHMARSGEAQTSNNLTEMGYELQAATNQLELAATQSGYKIEGEYAARLENLKSLADQLVKGNKPDMSQVAQAIDSAKQALANIDQMLTSQEAQAKVQPSAQPVESWIVVDDNTWLPVVDQMTGQMQLAHQAFADKDLKMAAEHIRQIGGFFKEEAANLQTEAGQNAFNTMSADLEKLAGQIEEGKVATLTDLNKDLLKAYDVDIKYHLAAASSEEHAPLVMWPITHLGQAIEAFNQNDTKTAAEDIVKAISFLRLEEARAVEPARAAVQNAITTLEQTATALREGQKTSGADLDKAFVLAYNALANHHYLRAAEAFNREALKESGLEMQAAAQYLHQIYASSSGHLKTTAALEKSLRTMSDQLINGVTPKAGEVNQLLEQTGQEINKIGETISATVHTPGS